MIKLKLKGDVVVGIDRNISPDYVAQENEVVVNELPHVSLAENQKAYVYYRNGQVEYEIVERG